MSIIVKLNNKNLETSEIKVYRSTERIDPANLPEPIATLAGNAQEFLDPEHLQYDTDYYYVVEVIGRHGSTLSPNRKYRLGVDVGPGPKRLVAGDEEFGLFGVFRPWDYEREIIDMFSPLYSASALSSTRLVKYMRKGKIYFMRVDPFYSNSPRTMRESGMLYSPTSVFRVSGPNYQTLLDANPPVIRRSGNYKYYIRCATLDTEEKDLNLVTATFDSTKFPAGKSEIVDLLRILHNYSLNLNRKQRPFQLGGYRFNNTFTLLVPDSTRDDQICGIAQASNQTWTISNSQTALNATSTGQWLPIIEYVGVAIDDETIFDPPVVENPEPEVPETPESGGGEVETP